MYMVTTFYKAAVFAKILSREFEQTSSFLSSTVSPYKGKGIMSNNVPLMYFSVVYSYFLYIIK